MEEKRGKGKIDTRSEEFPWGKKLPLQYIGMVVKEGKRKKKAKP
jgi:hypothetical protein